MTETLLVQQDTLVANIEAMTAFLCAARDAIFATEHDLTEAEKKGFCLCMAALKQNISLAYEADMEIWEMESGHA